MDELKIGSYQIGTNHKPFIIAEMSGNHNQSLEKALKIVEVAAACGADAIKLQTYTPDTITIDHKEGLFNIIDENSLWKGKNLYDLYKEAMTPWDWHQPLFDYAKKCGIIAFSTPFDETAVEFLEGLNAPVYKIASFENNHHPLLKKIAGLGKPVIMSTGASTLNDITESVEVLRKHRCSELILLKCTSTYPASPENSNVLTIPHMRNLFNCEVGLSDHTMGVGVAVAAVAYGASVVEKHFCLNRDEGGVDSAFSLEPHELKSLVVETKRAWQSLGTIQYCVQKDEKKSLNYKRSIYVTKDLAADEIFTSNNIRIIRPGDGLHPRFFDYVIGKKSRKAVKKGSPLQWDMF